MRVVLFGDGRWAADALVAMCATGHQLRAVVLRARPSDSCLETAARAHAIAVLQPADVNAPESVDMVRALDADLHLSIAYNQIFRAAIRGTAAWFVNVHAGQLPRYRGRNVINWALINGEREIGITVHCVDSGIDTGDIVLQRILPIAWTDTYADVLDRVVATIPGLAVEALALIETGQARPSPQPPGGFYCAGRQPGDEWLQWDQPSRQLYNKVRAITRPGPGARTLLGEAAITVWRASYDPRWPCYLGTPGEVVGRASEGVEVKTGDSVLRLHEVQYEQRLPEVPAWPIGTRLTVDGSAGIPPGRLAAAGEHLQRTDA
jgi:methionyl-tRNA formyltransferase